MIKTEIRFQEYCQYFIGRIDFQYQIIKSNDVLDYLIKQKQNFEKNCQYRPVCFNQGIILPDTDHRSNVDSKNG